MSNSLEDSFSTLERLFPDLVTTAQSEHQLQLEKASAGILARAVITLLRNPNNTEWQNLIQGEVMPDALAITLGQIANNLNAQKIDSDTRVEIKVAIDDILSFFYTQSGFNTIVPQILISFERIVEKIS